MYNPQPYYTASASQSGAAVLMQRVSYLLCTALLVTACTAYLSRDWSPVLTLPLFIGTFVCVIAMNFAKSVPGLNVILLYIFSCLWGCLVGPALANIVRYFPMGSTIVAESAVLTSVILAGLGTYVWISNKDFAYLGKILFWGLLALVIIGIVGMFWHAMFASGGVFMAYELAIVAIFLGFTLYDFSNIKHRFGPDDYVAATVALYLDFLNLFMALIRILMMLSGSGSSRRN